MNFLIGDLQGCARDLDRMLTTLGFSPSRDHLYVLGDMINRGPDSVGTLDRLMALGSSATCLLGNHDLHFLAVAAHRQNSGRRDTLDPLLEHPERSLYVDWLLQCPLAAQVDGWLLVHAGVPPQWSADTAMACAKEVSDCLQSAQANEFFAQMYGNEPTLWSPSLSGMDRLRYIVNALTRLRFVRPDGGLDLLTKEGLGAAPEGYLPWFEVPGRASAGQPIAFGHWSMLGVRQGPDWLALDGGCVWGGELAAAALMTAGPQIIRIPCEQACAP